jgi:hypothetical protein
MGTRDGQDPNHPTDLDIGNVVREHLEIDPTVPAPPDARQVRMPSDPRDVMVNLVPKPLAEARLLGFVIDHLRLELIGCLRQNDELH